MTGDLSRQILKSTVIRRWMLLDLRAFDRFFHPASRTQFQAPLAHDHRLFV